VRRVGVLTPTANWTVEAEMRRLLKGDFAAARLHSLDPDPMQRLVDYADQANVTASQFGEMKLAAVGFACTGSSYLIGEARAEAIMAAAPVPMQFAATAIRQYLGRIGARRIAVVSPYPERLHNAGLAYWRTAGFDVVHTARVDIGSDDTHRIYDLDGSEAVPLIAAARALGPDAILLSGTGMPTLASIDPAADIPVISSNYCLAEWLNAIAADG
jgi:maleate isomerase